MTRPASSRCPFVAPLVRRFADTDRTLVLVSDPIDALAVHQLRSDLPARYLAIDPAMSSTQALVLRRLLRGSPRIATFWWRFPEDAMDSD